jgi:hypothetical protein
VVRSTEVKSIVKTALRAFLTAACLTLASAAEQLPPGARMSWLVNGEIKLGVDLERGGAIVFLAPRGGENRVNNFDLGRQIQMSFFSGPVPFGSPKEHWKHIGWNPIQVGDDFGHRSKILAHENDGQQLFVRCQPMQWALDGVPGDCVLESWLELEGRVVKARGRLKNARSDRQLYPARLQELPALYANAPFHRVVSYVGDKPFTGAASSLAPVPVGKHPWSFWLGTEGWAALLDEKGQGLGLITPGRVHFTGGFAGKPGPNDSLGNSTGYLAGQGQEILDHDIDYEFRYEVVVGSEAEIRLRAAQYRPNSPPSWVFAADRQGWHHQNVQDKGWPIKGDLHLALFAADPQLISPYTFWQATEADTLELEAACQGAGERWTVMWQRWGEESFSAENVSTLELPADELFHTARVKLSAHPGYRGGLVRLRLDPPGGGGAEQWVKIKRVRLLSEKL